MKKTNKKRGFQKEVLPFLPLHNVVLFPGTFLPLVILDQKTIKNLKIIIERKNKHIFVSTLKQGMSINDPLSDKNVHPIGTKAEIIEHHSYKEGMNILLSGIEREKMDSLFVHDDKNENLAEIISFPVSNDINYKTEALHRENIKLFDNIKNHLKSELGIPIKDVVKNVPLLIHQTYLMGMLLSLSAEKKQDILNSSTTQSAVRLLHQFLLFESHVQKYQVEIEEKVSANLSQNQREFFLRKELHEIQKELGLDRENISLIIDKINESAMPDDIKNEMLNLARKLTSQNELSPDYQVLHSYLEYILEIPWNDTTTDHTDLVSAKMLLDKDHFGLYEVKDRILEHLAVMKLNPHSNSPLLCFVGPPGVGKTSLGESIAMALGRKFERLSLGGIHDEAELRGHRRTYVGAMPGRIIEAIRRSNSKNPLLMLDEVDKLGVSFRGDPYAVLMEILDPSQNFQFRDHYLDIPFDLSHVLFITTANSTQNIPKPLLDRMEVINIHGYSFFDKMHIARKYLIPLILKEVGLKDDQFILSDEILGMIISQFTRESGVRDLKRCLQKIARKLALDIVSNTSKDESKIDAQSLHLYLGHEKKSLDSIRSKWSVGVSTGMAWTETGGEIIFIESAFLPNQKNEIQVTGNIGDIMKESISCSFTYLLNHLHSIDYVWDKNNGLHIHVPAGSTPKDGPSAGLPICVAMASLFLNKPVMQHYAMTGEITLTGLILPVGGIKEKVLAAHRLGIHHIVLPQQNKDSLEDIPNDVQNMLSFHFVKDIHDVLEMFFH